MQTVYVHYVNFDEDNTKN